MYRSLLRATYCGLVSVIAAFGLSAQAATIDDTGSSAYWGGLNSYNPSNGDVISAPADPSFNISKAEVTRPDANTLLVKIFTNYAGLPGTGPADGTTYGSLFFTPTANYSPIINTVVDPINGGASHYSGDVYQPNDWTTAFVMNPPVNSPNVSGSGSLYSTGTVNGQTLIGGVVQKYSTTTGTIVMSNVNGNPISYPGAGNPGYYFRQGQAVQYTPGAGQGTLGGAGSTWNVDTVNDIITFSIVDNGVLGYNFALAWAMTCANDVIQGTVSLPVPPPHGGGTVPLPSAFLLMGTVLAGAGGISGWRRRRVRAAA